MPLPAVAVSQTPEEKFREYLTSRPDPKRFTDQMRELVRREMCAAYPLDPSLEVDVGVGSDWLNAK